MRVACMFLMGVMPLTGVQEAVGTLKDIFEFHAYPPTSALPDATEFETAVTITAIE